MQVGCIQVLYNPNPYILEQSVRNIIEQTDILVIVDNSPKITDLDFIHDNPKIIYIFNNKNLGIAKAQNIGIRKLNETNTDYIYFSDQDSIPPRDTVKVLMKDYEWLVRQNIRVGAIGPTIINRQTNKAYKGRIKKGKHVSPSIIEVSEIISSGSLIPMEALRKVGYMEDDLFIDGVDHEWCWRANDLDGYRFFISQNVQMSHQQGEGDRTFMGIRIAISSTFRAYFQYRNYVILAKRRYVPIYWKISNGIKFAIRLVYYPLFVAPRIKYLKNSILGIMDGVLNKFSRNVK